MLDALCGTADQMDARPVPPLGVPSPIGVLPGYFRAARRGRSVEALTLSPEARTPAEATRWGE